MSGNSVQAETDFQSRLGYVFKDQGLMRLALTHASAGANQNYERLEFLGDRVLALLMAELIYATFPAEAEGDLALRHAALVSGQTLAGLADAVGLSDVLRLSGAERAGGGAKNENILADVLEALIGAIYLDGGLEPCKPVVAGLWRDVLHTMVTPPRDPKTGLQEWTQARGLPLPQYDMTGRDGPDHAPLFTITVTVKGFDPVSAEGASRRAGEKAAAAILLDRIEGRGA